MNAKDLMIGDWVKLSKGNWSENRQVGLIDIEMIAESVYLAEPIPLTQEILEKNGFSLDEYGEWYEREVSVKERNYWVNVAFRNDSVSVYDLDILTGGRSSICIHKNYVHELQHALRLCQIEKEIEL